LSSPDQRDVQESGKGVKEEVKQLWNALFVAGILAVAGGGAFAQRYVPPSGSGTTGGTTGTTTTSGTTTTPATHNPDPFGLTLAASGTAAAVGYVMRRKRAMAG
jgi:hypothetical protein